MNSLNNRLFEFPDDFMVFENILDSLNHTTPKKISRNDFNNLKGNFLKETGEDKFGKKYDLFLPEDLSYGESLSFIDFLSNKFNLTNYTPYEKIISQIKVSIGTILREKGNEEGEKYLNDLSKKYNISDAFIEKIKDSRMNFSDSRIMIKNIKENRKNNDNSKLGENPDDVSLSFDELKILFGEEFDLTFFRKGINMLRLGMMTFTKDEYKKLKEKNPGKLLRSDFFLDEQERLLREKIRIDYFKEKLDELRENKILKNDIENLEIAVTQKILEVIYDFGHQSTENRYKPNKILETKELQCVGYSLLGHAFLSELGIKHERLIIPNHMALSVIIGGQNYYFDGAMDNLLFEFEYGNKFGEFNELILSCNHVKINVDNKIISNNGNIIAKKGDIEKSLLSTIFLNNSINNSMLLDKQIINNMLNKAIKLMKNSNIYINLAKNLYYLKRYDESINMCNKFIECRPNNSYGYYIKGENYEKLGNEELADLYYYSSDLLKGGQENKSEIEYGEEKKQIPKLILEKKYEELRVYLLSLEKQINK